MTNRTDHIKNQLRTEDEDDSSFDFERPDDESIQARPPRQNRFGNLFVIFLIVAFGIFLLRGSGNLSLNPFSYISESGLMSSQPSENLLNRMGVRMAEMGYVGLDHDDLRALRRDGVTATYISNVRALGYTDLTIQNAVSLAKADASSAFIAMMIELGYTLTVEEIVMLRDAGVTAHYTSNIHDLGYRDLTTDQLIRMRRIGVTPALIRRLQQERGDAVPMEDIIRYRISNQ